MNIFLLFLSFSPANNRKDDRKGGTIQSVTTSNPHTAVNLRKSITYAHAYRIYIYIKCIDISHHTWKWLCTRYLESHYYHYYYYYFYFDSATILQALSWDMVLVLPAAVVKTRHKVALGDGSGVSCLRASTCRRRIRFQDDDDRAIFRETGNADRLLSISNDFPIYAYYKEHITNNYCCKP